MTPLPSLDGVRGPAVSAAAVAVSDCDECPLTLHSPDGAVVMRLESASERFPSGAAAAVAEDAGDEDVKIDRPFTLTDVVPSYNCPAGYDDGDDGGWTMRPTWKSMPRIGE